MKKLLLLLFLILAFCLSLFSQDKKSGLNPWGGANGVQASIGYLNHFEREVSYIMTNSPKAIREQDYGLLAGFHSISEGINYAYSDNHSFVGPKIYFQTTFAVLTAQLGMDYLSDYKSISGVRITPKAGVSLFGFASVLYGRNIGITGNLGEIGLIRSDMVNIQVQIPKSFF